MKKLTKLTQEQTDQIPGWVEKWVSASLDVRPTNKPLVEGGIRDCYKFAGLDEPKKIIWVESPIKAICVGPSIESFMQSGCSLEKAIQRALSGETDRVAVQKNWHLYFGGAMWSSWSAYLTFFKDVVKLEAPGNTWRMEEAFTNAQSAGWWWPHSEFVVISERHSHISLNPQGELHSPTGPAISWPDGWGLYSLNGIVVPEWVVMDPQADRIIKDLPNTEQRRVAFAHLGWENAIEHLGLSVIDAHPDPKIGTLYTLPTSVVEQGQATLLLAENGSPDMDGTYRMYGLLASGTAKTAIEAQASLAQLTVEEWKALDGRS